MAGDERKMDKNKQTKTKQNNNKKKTKKGTKYKHTIKQYCQSLDQRRAQAE
jgi:hypothetical protein